MMTNALDTEQVQEDNDKGEKEGDIKNNQNENVQKFATDDFVRKIRTIMDKSKCFDIF